MPKIASLPRLVGPQAYLRCNAHSLLQTWNSPMIFPFLCYPAGHFQSLFGAVLRSSRSYSSQAFVLKLGNAKFN